MYSKKLIIVILANLLNFNNFNVLNSGSVWSLYLLQVIIRTAFFCRAKTLLLFKDTLHHAILYHVNIVECEFNGII